MRIVINDANILIDIAKLDLLEAFSNLNFDLYTTDFVYEELNEIQKSPISTLLIKDHLTIIETEDIQDFQNITTLLENSNGLSFEDCSVWYYSSKMSGTLLTGDGKLRKRASEDGVEVRGVLFIFDELINQNLLSYNDAVDKMKQLKLLNNRLPKNEIDKRIESWTLLK